MEESISLIDYLKNKYQDIGPLIGDEDLIFRDSKEYINLLFQSRVIEVPTWQNWRISDEILRLNSYLEVVDTLIETLTREKSKNVLVNGYHDPSSLFIWSTKTFNPYVSFSVNTLKGSNWQKLYNRIGCERFVRLLLGTKCFVPGKEGNYVQLFGPSTVSESRPKTTTSKYAMLFSKPYHMQNETRLLPEDPIDLVRAIVKQRSEKSYKNVPKKYRGLKEVCEKLIENDSKCKYASIYWNICVKGEVSSSCTPLAKVVSFVLVVLKKIFHDEVFGSPFNRSKVTKYVITHVKSGMNEKNPIDNIVSSMKLTDINWLGKSRHTTSLQDFQSRKQILGTFLNWLISSFTCVLIANFWYVTDLSHGNDKTLIFYPHIVWKNTSQNWLQEFKSTYLRNGKKSKAEGIHDVFNSGVLRIVPKNNGFRALCVPVKADKSRNLSKYDYSQYMNNYIKPIKEIILYKQREYLKSLSASPICYSVEDIAACITSYKNKLKSNIGVIPDLYYCKFDMENCFDNINHDKLMFCVERLFHDDDPDKYFYVRQYMEHNGYYARRRFGLQTDDIENFSIINYKNTDSKPVNSRIVVDKVKTVKFKKSTILDFLSNVIYNSSVILPNGEKFLRKKGVSQGFPLSATLCDLFYSILIHEELDRVMRLHCMDSLLVRLVDDFLLISIDHGMCSTIFDIVNDVNFKNQGAIVNNSKTLRTSSNESSCIEFVGLRLVTKSLDILRDVVCFGKSVSFPHVKSFKSGYANLQSFYNNKLHNFLISRETNTFGSILKNIKLTLSMTLYIFYNIYKKLKRESHRFDIIKLRLLMLKLLEITLSKYKRVNNTSEGMNLIIFNFKNLVSRKLNILKIKDIDAIFEGII